MKCHNLFSPLGQQKPTHDITSQPPNLPQYNCLFPKANTLNFFFAQLNRLTFLHYSYLACHLDVIVLPSWTTHRFNSLLAINLDWHRPRICTDIWNWSQQTVSVAQNKDQEQMKILATLKSEDNWEVNRQIAFLGNSNGNTKNRNARLTGMWLQLHIFTVQTVEGYRPSIRVSPEIFNLFR